MNSIPEIQGQIVKIDLKTNIDTHWCFMMMIPAARIGVTVTRVECWLFLESGSVAVSFGALVIVHVRTWVVD